MKDIFVEIQILAASTKNLPPLSCTINVISANSASRVWTPCLTPSVTSTNKKLCYYFVSFCSFSIFLITLIVIHLKFELKNMNWSAKI